MNIYLIGMPGSGKSTLGKELASLMNMHFVDMDDEIVREEKMSVEDIFSIHGEKAFRDMETKLLKKLNKNDHQVVSTGGGAPCFNKNIELIRKAGRVVFIDTPVNIIAERLIRSGSDIRPMFKGKDRNEIIKLLGDKRAERISFYKQADVVVSGEDITAEDVKKAISEKS